MTAAIVLCAGLGTRLAPLTDELAKPLMPVGDRPLLAHIAAALERAAISTIVANTHHRSHDFADVIKDWKPEVHLIHEPVILGTAGGVAHAASALGQGPALVWNGDILAPALDVAALLARHRQAPAGALWVVEPTAAGKGTVGLDDEGRVVRLRGERFGHETAGGDFLGVQVMGSELRRTLPRKGCLVGDVALPLLRRGGRIDTFLYRGEWDDIGQPGALLRANLRWLAARGLTAWSHAGATVGTDVTLELSVVGEGAAASGAGIVRECVVFPGASIDAPASRILAARRATLTVDDGA
jgi:mannose-1-phosphate guanylyltransferase